jgi:valyl-tRNA synthetase
MDKAYNPQQHEDDIYKKWEDTGAFLPKGDGEPFVVAIPPPNVTGQLHAGHAMVLTIEDIMIRFERMQGKRTLWVPGTDHAAIATESVVIKNLGVQSREAFSREEFLEKCREWTRVTHNTITNQIKKIGSSCDWSREAFTFDDPRNRAVNHIFKMLYEADLIYRGNRMVNWSVGAQSVLADDEVEWEEQTESFYSIRCGEFIVGTIRSETKCADSPVVVHPTAEYIRAKYSDSSGKSECFIMAKSLFDDSERRTKELNLLDPNATWEVVETLSGKDLEGREFEYETYAGKRKFFVLADEVIDPKKGTGAMTISSCHSADDYDLAKRRRLDNTYIQKIDFKGNMTAIAGPCEGMPILKARKKSAEIMKEKGLLLGENTHYSHRVPLCYRSGCVVESMISKQWFIAVEKEFVDQWTGETTTLKKLTADAVRENSVQIVPDRFEKVYFHWIDNLRDWCISRQIWWGHRVPVWYDEKGEVVAVGNTEKPNADWNQDEDTLDTWFSSATWPFSIFGWPDKTQDLEQFYPTSVLETGHDILFFWVARMIMFGKFATGKYPFHTVYLNGLVRDEKGQKMSKSKGNGIDPIEIIKEFGADALRLSLLIGLTPGNNINLGKEKIEGCRNFCNKLWNISRFLLDQEIGEMPTSPNTDLQEWIWEETDALAHFITEELKKYNFGGSAQALWEYTWNAFADFGIEAAKAEKSPETNAVLLNTLKKLLILWHPFLPFLTETIWKELQEKGFAENTMLIETKWEKGNDLKSKQNVFADIIAVITKIRSMRKNAGVDPTKKITALLFPSEIKAKEILQRNSNIIKLLAGLEEITIVSEFNHTEEGARDTIAGIDIFLPNSGMIDPKEEKKRIEKEIEKTEKLLASLEIRLSNPSYAQNAPTHLVEETKKQYKEAKEKLAKLRKV